MTDLIKFGKRLKLKTAEGIKKSDYYTDAILGCLSGILERKLSSKQVELLDLACGRGYISIVLGLVYPQIKNIIATDVNFRAAQLTRKNVTLYNLASKVAVKQGDLFEPVKGCKFDFIVTSPPAMPITDEELILIGDKVGVFHRFSSVGGERGRNLIDRIIFQSSAYLKKEGFLIFVHADFIDIEETRTKIAQAGLFAAILGKQKKRLKETVLTRMLKPKIEKSGYKFKKDKAGEEYFTLIVFSGRKK